MVEVVMALLLAGACMGDANNSGVIGTADFSAFRQAFGSSVGDPEYNPLQDYDMSGTVGTTDFAILKAVWNQPCRRIFGIELHPELHPQCTIEWAFGARLPLWENGKCIRVPMVPWFAPVMWCDGKATMLVESEGECSGQSPLPLITEEVK